MADMSSSSQTTAPLTTPRSVKSLTCYFWATTGSCKFSEKDCLYSHHHTGRIASGPTRREPGRPAVAGKNAYKDRPIYQNWRAAHHHYEQESKNALNRQIQNIYNKAQSQPQAATQSTHNMVHAADFRDNSADRGEPIFGISGSVNYGPGIFLGDHNGEVQQLSGMPLNESVTTPSEASNDAEIQAHVSHFLRTKDAVITQMSREIDNLTAHLEKQCEELFNEIRTTMLVIHNLPVDASPRPSADAISPPYGRLPTNSERLLIAAQNMIRTIGASAMLLSSTQTTKADISSRLEGLGEGYLVAQEWSR